MLRVIPVEVILRLHVCSAILIVEVILRLCLAILIRKIASLLVWPSCDVKELRSIRWFLVHLVELFPTRVVWILSDPTICFGDTRWSLLCSPPLECVTRQTPSGRRLIFKTLFFVKFQEFNGNKTTIYFLYVRSYVHYCQYNSCTVTVGLYVYTCIIHYNKRTVDLFFPNTTCTRYRVIL